MELWDGTSPWIADALVVTGVAVMTIGVYGLIKMPDIYTKLHAASKSVFLGAIALAAASIATGERDIIFRVALISVFLLLTTPVAAHVMAKAAYEESHRMDRNPSEPIPIQSEDALSIT